MPKPTLPVTPLTINGKEYNLVFNFRSIAEAERVMTPSNPGINLIAAQWQQLTAANVTGLFLAGLLTNHKELVKDPKTGFEPALDLLDEAMTADSIAVLEALNTGYRGFAPEPIDTKKDDEAEVVADPLPPGN